MAEKTAISWCDHTWNPWIGCQKVSPACDGCYAENLMATRMGRVEWGGPGKGAGTRARTSPHTWNDPFRWQRKAEAAGTRPFVFCASLADIFDNQVPAEWRRDAFDVMRRTPRLVYLLLTKRPSMIAKLAAEAGGLPSNAAIGTTVEDQDRGINLFSLAIAARATRPLFTFSSFEPLLGAVDPTRVVLGESAAEFFGHPEIRSVRFLFDALRGAPSINLPPLGWAITGGETDQGAHRARPTHPDWFRSLRDQAAAAGVPFHHKQNGEWMSCGDWYDTHPESLPICTWDVNQWTDDGSREHLEWVARVGKTRAGRLLDGVLHDARPAVPAMGAC